MSDLFSIYEDSLNIVLKTLNSSLESERLNDALLENIHNNLKEAKRIVCIIFINIDKTNGIRNI